MLGLSAFEVLTWFDPVGRAGTASVTGTAADERVRLSGHFTHTEMDGRGGNDRLRIDFPPGTLTGGSGDDHLVGGRFDDLLIGGPGHDSAAGRRGTDQCSAEVEVSCELPVT